MTLEYIPKFSQDKVYNLLPINYRKRSKPADIEEFDNSSKKELVRKRFYKLKLGESEIIHLTLGKNLKFVFDKTKSFYEECPKCTCKPLFINDGQTFNLFGQEFFQGTPIDKKYASNEISDEDVAKIVSKIQKIFSSLEVESTHEAFLEEFKEFKEIILSNNSLHLFDKDFLNKCVFPYLENSLLPKYFSVRWSPGDLAARNILVDNDLNFRIIDCEFAHETNFHEEDWVRLTVFSSGNFKETPSVKKRLNQVDPWYHIYLCLRQTWLNRIIWQNDDYNHFAREDLYTILKLTETFGSNNKHVSLLIGGVLDVSRKSLNEISAEKDIRIQKENELDAEKQLRVQKESELVAERLLNSKIKDKLNSENQIKLSLENELDAEKQLRVQKENELASEKELRLQKEDDLNCERQSRLSLENELKVKNDKIVRMQNSFSWKYTSILRLFRRKLFDRKKSKFDPKLYLRLNPDLEEVLGYDLEAARNHFLNYGINEKRPYTKKCKQTKINRTYSYWLKHKEPRDNHNCIVKYKENTKVFFSIIMPVYNTNINHLKDAIESVLKQSFKNWELCISDDCSTSKETINLLKYYSELDSRIKVFYRKSNGNISVNTKSAISLAKGKYLAFLDHDDVLSLNALQVVYFYVKKMNPKLIYSDEDKIDQNGKRCSPYFKPDWNYNLFLSQNYICHFLVIEKDIYEKHGNFRSSCDGAQDWDNLLHIIPYVKESEIYHIDKILYHWRIHPASTAYSVESKSYAIQSSLKALNDYLKRERIDATVECIENYYFHVTHSIPQIKPKVDIIIPTRNNYLILEKCVSSIIKNTKYLNYNIIVVDNNSDDPSLLKFYSNMTDKITLLTYSGDFNHSAINNFATKHTSSELLLFLNDDTEIINENWLTELVSASQQKDVAVVGCKLLYPNFKVQHAGVIIGVGPFAGHAFRHTESDSNVMGCRNNLKQNYTAVTGACMLVKRKIYEIVGGFDEINLPTSYNDVDLCLRIRNKEYKIVYTPTTLIHHESYSRGFPDNKIKKEKEKKYCDYMRKCWAKIYNHDPCYNRHLTREYEDFGL